MTDTKEKIIPLTTIRHHKGMNPGEDFAVPESEAEKLLNGRIARTRGPSALQAVVDAGLLEARAPKSKDDLETLKYPELLDKAKEIATSRGESLDEVAGKKKDDVLAYIRAHQG